MNADKTVKLEHGTVEIFERGDVRVHAYITHDAIDDVCLVLEHAGQAAVIELPPFKENIAELERYIAGLGVKTVAKIVDYHAAGDTFMHDVPAYSTEEANEYNTTGGGAGLIKGFISSFGAGFDSSVRLGEKILKAGKTQIAGIEMEILPNSEAFEIAIPSIKTVYMHMLGHDCHSIVPGKAGSEAMAANLQGYLDQGYELFLSAHYAPEGREDVETKIRYLRRENEIAAASKDAADFTAKMKAEFPGYSGENYLGISAGIYFPSQ